MCGFLFFSTNSLSTTAEEELRRQWAFTALAAEVFLEEYHLDKKLKLKQTTDKTNITLLFNSLVGALEFLPTHPLESSRFSKKNAVASLKKIPQWKKIDFFTSIDLDKSRTGCEGDKTKANISCKIQQLIVSAGPKKRSSDLEPLNEMQKLSVLGSPAMKTPTMQTFYALRLTQLQVYPEALRALLGLQKKDPAYRVLYDKVQRLYGLRQSAEGSVALRQSL